MRRVLGFLLVAMAIHCRPAFAQEAGTYQIEMFPGLVRLLVLDASYDNLVVGSDVITVVPVGEKSVSIAAQKAGYSSIIFVDKRGNLVGRAEVTVIPSERVGRDVVTITRGTQGQDYLCGGSDGWCIGVAPVPPPVTYNYNFFTTAGQGESGSSPPPPPVQAP